MDASSDIFQVPTSNFLIYGHNMKNGTMFHDMLKYKDKSFYQEHKTFRFDTIYKGGQGTYEIIAAGYSKIYPEDSDAFKYYQYAGITSRSDFNEYLKGVQGLSEYNTGVYLQNTVIKPGDSFHLCLSREERQILVLLWANVPMLSR